MKKILDRKYMMFVRNGEHYNLFYALMKNITQEMSRELKILDFWKTFADALEKENEAYLNSQKYAADVEKLGLTNEVVELRQSAERFQTEVSIRANERLTRTYRVNMVQIRPVVEKAFADLADLITASYLTAAYMDRDAEKAARIEQIIDRMNAEILRTIETVTRRSARAKGKTAEDAPEEPIEPEETVS